MQLCFDATRFGLGLKEAIEFAASKKIPAVEFTFDSFTTTAKSLTLSDVEAEYLAEVQKLCRDNTIEVACIRLNGMLDVSDKKAVKQFHQMMQKLGLVTRAVGCQRISFSLNPSGEANWIDHAADAINPVLAQMDKIGVKLLLSLSTPAANRGKTLRQWRPMEPQEWRDLIAHCPGLALSFSAADCAWQSIDYLGILPGLVAAIEHVEANDVEINRPMLVDSGLFGPLWWRYRRPGKGQLDWRQLIEALKMYDYQGKLSIHLDDEFIGEATDDLENSLDESVKFLAPLLKY